ncbi:MAG: hypothetical protein ACP5RS_06105 [Thermoplasmata archaeon]
MRTSLPLSVFTLALGDSLLYFISSSTLEYTFVIVLTFFGFLSIAISILKTTDNNLKYLQIVLMSGYTVLSFGYIHNLMPIVYYSNRNIPLFVISFTLMILSLFFHQLFEYFKNFSKKLMDNGFDEHEIYTELYAFETYLILLGLAALVISAGIYAVMYMLPKIKIGIIGSIIAFSIAFFIWLKFISKTEDNKNIN